VKDKYLLLSDGTSPHTLKWVKELSKYFELYLVSLNGMNTSLLEYIEEDKIYVLNESVKTAGGNFKLLLKYFEIKKIVDEVSPLYVNAHYLSSYGVLAALLKKSNRTIKLIQSTWGSDVLVTPFENFVKRKIAIFALSHADLITSDSLFMSDKIDEIYSNDMTTTFPFGLEPFEIQETIEKDEYLIFSNRALLENYNIDKVVKWFAQLEDKKYRLVIAHNGDMKELLEELIEQYSLENRVEFVGFLTQEEQNSFYAKAKYYISIPSSDSTAVSLLEAMKFGCYPIVSQLSANREWILDGVNGSYFTNLLECPTIRYDVISINQNIIKEKAIFEKSIESYLEKVKEL